MVNRTYSIDSASVLRKSLFSSTKEKHKLVEEVFGLHNELNEEKLLHLYKSLLVTRITFSSHLEYLENTLGIKTYNRSLIQELRKDTGGQTFQKPVVNNGLEVADLSVQTGIFYVFSGSSMGAKVILKRSEEMALRTSVNYFRKLVETSDSQMSTLKELLSRNDIVADKVIYSALQTFDLIHRIASSEL